MNNGFSGFKRLNIIARYNENLDWVENLSGNVLVYNKGDNYKWPYQVVHTKNFGRESETYIRAIIENYESLNNFDDIVFLQGEPFEHCKNLFDSLKMTATDKFLPLGDYFSLHQTPREDYIFFDHVGIIEILLKKMKGVDEFPNSKKFIYKMDHLDGRVLDKTDELFEIMGLCSILGLDYRNLELTWVCGSQYLVRTSAILSKSLEWWKELHYLISYSEEVCEYHLGYIFERIWPIIWEYSDH